MTRRTSSRGKPGAGDGTDRPARWKAPLALLLGLLLALALAELVLRLIGFEYQLRIHLVQNTAPNPDRVLDHFDIDADLLWVPGDYGDVLDEARRRPPRIAFLGDSRTHLGRHHRYLMERLAAETGGETPWANYGVAGWSVVQGREQLARDVAPLAPAVVVIDYGWNDHWLSIGLEDRETLRIVRLPWYRGQALRLQQLLLQTHVGLRSETPPPLRVPLETFREVLGEMVRAVRAFGGTPVLMTAGTAHERGREPEYLAGRWVADLSELVPLHRRYVDGVRAVADEERADLCDAADVLDHVPAEERRELLFLPDGIHFQEAGDRFLASFLHDCLAFHGLLEPLRTTR